MSVPLPDEFLFGTAYYHEYHPVERLDEDMRLMVEAAFNVVRLGESTWALWEPRDGEFEFAWIDRVIDAANRAGLKVILGTPTYAVPPWMHAKNPEVTRINLDGQPEPLGYRQSADLGHPAYRFHCERLLRAIVPRYRDHANVIGWQIDNETNTFGLPGGPRLERDFLERLKRRFGTPERLSEVWGLQYWSKNIHDWQDMFTRRKTPFPAHKLEWNRHLQDLVTDFVGWQAGLLRELRGPHQFITHDFSCISPRDLRMRDIAQHLDHVGVNPYDNYQDAYAGEVLNFCADIGWSIGGFRPFLTLETAASIDGAGHFFPPYDNQVRLNAYTFLAAGTQAVLYWHWHSLHYGLEQAFCGILPHDYVPGRVYREVQRLGHELRRITPALLGATKEKSVAVLHDIDSLWGLEHEPSQPRIDYGQQSSQAARSCLELNAECDVLLDLADVQPHHRLLIVPSLFIASDAQLATIATFVERGGHVFLGPRAGHCDEFMRVRWTPQPGGPLRGLAGVGYQEKAALAAPVPLAGDVGSLPPEETVARMWADLLEPTTAEVLLRYEHPFYGRFAALTVQPHASGGSVTYLGTTVGDALYRRILAGVLDRAGVARPPAPAGVRVRRSRTRDGRTVTFYLNYTGDPVVITHAGGAAQELLSERACPAGGTIRLDPWDSAVVLDERP